MGISKLNRDSAFAVDVDDGIYSSRCPLRDFCEAPAYAASGTGVDGLLAAAE